MFGSGEEILLCFGLAVLTLASVLKTRLFVKLQNDKYAKWMEDDDEENPSSSEEVVGRHKSLTGQKLSRLKRNAPAEASLSYATIQVPRPTPPAKSRWVTKILCSFFGEDITTVAPLAKRRLAAVAVGSLGGGVSAASKSKRGESMLDEGDKRAIRNAMPGFLMKGFDCTRGDGEGYRPNVPHTHYISSKRRRTIHSLLEEQNVKEMGRALQSLHSDDVKKLYLLCDQEGRWMTAVCLTQALEAREGRRNVEAPGPSSLDLEHIVSCLQCTLRHSRRRQVALDFFEQYGTKVPLENTIYTQLLERCQTPDDLRAVILILDSAKRFRTEFTDELYSSFIKAFCQTGNWERGMSLYETLKEEKLLALERPLIWGGFFRKKTSYTLDAIRSSNEEGQNTDISNNEDHHDDSIINSSAPPVRNDTGSMTASLLVPPRQISNDPKLLSLLPPDIHRHLLVAVLKQREGAKEVCTLSTEDVHFGGGKVKTTNFSSLAYQLYQEMCQFAPNEISVALLEALSQETHPASSLEKKEAATAPSIAIQLAKHHLLLSSVAKNIINENIEEKRMDGRSSHNKKVEKETEDIWNTSMALFAQNKNPETLELLLKCVLFRMPAALLKSKEEGVTFGAEKRQKQHHTSMQQLLHQETEDVPLTISAARTIHQAGNWALAIAFAQRSLRQKVFAPVSILAHCVAVKSGGTQWSAASKLCSQLFARRHQPPTVHELSLCVHATICSGKWDSALFWIERAHSRGVRFSPELYDAVFHIHHQRGGAPLYSSTASRGNWEQALATFLQMRQLGGHCTEKGVFDVLDVSGTKKKTSAALQVLSWTNSIFWTR